MNEPTEAEFMAAYEASQSDYEDKFNRVSDALRHSPDVLKEELVMRTFILAFLGHHYDARLRAYLKRRSRQNLASLYAVEGAILKELSSGGKTNSSLKVQSNSRPLSPSAILLTGVGAAVGGAAVAMTAGLAAPFVLPSIAAAIGSASIAGSMGVAAVATVCGAAGAGWSGYKVSKHFADVDGMNFWPVQTNEPNTKNTKALGLTICVSGWYTNKADLPAHWSCMQSSPDTCIVMEYEAQLMESLGNLWEEMAMSTVAGMAVGEALRTTVIGTALAAVAWPLTLLQLGSMVDHPWWLAVGRSRRVGVLLARELHARSLQGARPVSLYGVSMGAIVVQHCLEELSRLGSFGLIENVLLLGLPAKLPKPDQVKRLRLVCSGRFVHGYSRKDWLLRFLFRTTRLHVGEVAGLVPWDVDGVESVDLTNLVSTHTEFRDKLDEIIDLLGLNV